MASNSHSVEELLQIVSQLKARNVILERLVSVGKRASITSSQEQQAIPKATSKAWARVHDCCLVYFGPTGTTASQILQQALQKEFAEDKFIVLRCGDSHPTSSVLENIEQSIGRSSTILALLSEFSLRSQEFVYALDVASANQNNMILVHDVLSCQFPDCSGLPDNIQAFFHEKAVSFLEEYTSSAVSQITTRIEVFESEHAQQNALTAEILAQKKENMLRTTLHSHPLELVNLYEMYQSVGNFFLCDECNQKIDLRHKPMAYHCERCEFDLCEPCAKSNVLSFDTRVFLSHRRSTAQVIAGRLYDGLSSEYKVFLDSEAQFVLHELELIVEKTELFVFILSPGILDSVWCLKELRSAIQHKKKIVLVRHFQYELPKVFPDSLEDVKDTLLHAPTITWMAEYNHECIQLIKKHHLGVTDAQLEKLRTWIKPNKLEDQLNKHTLTELSLNNWDGTAFQAIVGLKVNFNYPVEKITAVRRDVLRQPSASFDESDAEALQLLPNLQTLDLSFNDIIPAVGRQLVTCSQLKELKVGFTPVTGPAFLRRIVRCENLESISAEQSILDDEGMEILASLPTLKKLNVQDCGHLTRSAIEKFIMVRPDVEILFTESNSS